MALGISVANKEIKDERKVCGARSSVGTILNMRDGQDYEWLSMLGLGMLYLMMFQEH